ncbi:hypothetical protein BDV19DRAFT_383334 [Aspergillus venezuelensis]
MAQTQKGTVPVPPGETYNGEFSHQYLYTENRAVVISGVIFCTICLGLRVFTKISLVRNFGWDDVTQALSLYGYNNGGTGLHISNITPEMFLSFQKGILAAGVVYVPSLALAKASLIILYYRIVSAQRRYRYALYIIAAVVVGYSIAITFALIFACRPISKAWNSAVMTNTVTDVALIVVPVPVVVILNMPTIQKIVLLFMFVIGCATVITSIIRLVTLFPFLRTQDKTRIYGCTNVEANFIIICACLPFLRHFLRRYALKLIGEGSSAQRYFKSYGAYGAGGPFTTRSWRRGPEHSILQDEIELAEHGSGVRIVKEVQWGVTEERRDALTAVYIAET